MQLHYYYHLNTIMINNDKRKENRSYLNGMFWNLRAADGTNKQKNPFY